MTGLATGVADVGALTDVIVLPGAASVGDGEGAVDIVGDGEGAVDIVGRVVTAPPIS